MLLAVLLNKGNLNLSCEPVVSCKEIIVAECFCCIMQEIACLEICGKEGEVLKILRFAKLFEGQGVVTVPIKY